MPGRSPGWLRLLDQRSPPLFNQVVVWTLLATALFLAIWPFRIEAGERSGVASLLFWAPDEFVRSSVTWYATRGLLIAGTCLWLMQCWLPWSCWLVVAAFTTLWSLHVETTYNTAHIFHMANMLLVLQAIWATGEAPLINRRLAAGDYWRLPLVPRWLTLASIAYIGLFHTAAGLSKLTFSGLDWANGTSLQLWAYLWGRRWSPTTQLLLHSRTAAQALQVFTLIIETAGIFAVFPKLRPWIGWGLVGFYAGVLATFDYGFQFNGVLTALYFLPFERWLNSSHHTKSGV